MDNIKEEEQVQVSVNSIPLFIKKLWKMVNDKDAEDIISWSPTGDSFIIHDQFEFITKLLPQYFKHQNMASFVRQLNFYTFHKVPNATDEIQFAHTCFLKDVPEILPFIRRKTPVMKQKTVANFQDQEVENLLNEIKNLKGKHTLVDKELSMLKQENAALWNELNSLRLKYTKQSTIINMLIHFLITYIHSHQTAFSKQNIQVSTDENSGNLKRGPTLLEIDYKNNKNVGKTGHNPYTMLEPGTSNSITYSVKLPENEQKRQRKNIHSLEEVVTYPKRPKIPQRELTYSIKLPGSQTEKLNRPEIQRSLLEILKENEKLCEEDTDELLTEFETECDNVTGLEAQEETSEDMNAEMPENSTYTISYPAESPVPHTSHPKTPDALEEIVNVTPIKVEKIENQSSIPTKAADKFIKKEIPVKTTSGTQKCTITYPKDLSSVENQPNKNIEVLDHVILKNNPGKTITKPKFIKIPIKHLKRPLTANQKLIKTNSVKAPPTKSSTVRHLPKKTPTSKTVNPEGALLEILKENEKLTKDDPIEKKADNISSLIDNPSIDENFGDFYIDGTDEPFIPENNISSVTKEPIVEPISKEKSFNILDNPKENLGMYVNNTQEEIDILQDILNNLTSNDLSEILNTDPPNIDLETEHTEPEGLQDEEIGRYLNTDESADKYFEWNLENDPTS